MRLTRAHDEGTQARPQDRLPGWAARRPHALVAVAATVTAGAMLGLGGLPAVAADAAPTWKFDLGTATSPVADGYQQVTDATRYSTATGFGIVPADGVTPISRDRGATDAADRDFVAGTAWDFVLDVPASRSPERTVTS